MGTANWVIVSQPLSTHNSSEVQEYRVTVLNTVFTRLKAKVLFYSTRFNKFPLKRWTLSVWRDKPTVRVKVYRRTPAGTAGTEALSVLYNFRPISKLPTLAKEKLATDKIIAFINGNGFCQVLEQVIVQRLHFSLLLMWLYCSCWQWSLVCFMSFRSYSSFGHGWPPGFKLRL